MATARNVTPIGNSSPGLMLRRLIDQEEEIEHVLVVVQAKDGITQTFYTKMGNSDLTWLAWNMQDEISRALNSDD